MLAPFAKKLEKSGETADKHLEVQMGSVSSSLNPAVADLFQKLSDVDSPVLKSPAAMSALEKAPTADIVQLSAAASQLANVNALFGIPASTDSGSNTILQTLENEGATLTPAEQAAEEQAAAQSMLTQGLFGTGTNQAGTLFNTIG